MTAGNDIHQIVEFTCSAEELFKAIIDPSIQAQYTHSEVTGGHEVGDTFSAYDGYIFGQNTKIEVGNLIEQNWAADEPDWPEGIFSKVRYEIEPTDDGCKLTFTHTEIPEAVTADFAQGWHDYYWNPIKDFYS